MIPFAIVIDVFLPNAEELRERALKLNYSLKGPYPGLNSVEKINIPGLDEMVSRLVYQPVRPPWTKNYSHGSFRLALAKDDEPAKIHIDQSHWSGILYLSRPEDCRGGTEFFRHKATGLDQFPFSAEQLREHGFADHADAHRLLIERDGTNDSAWESLMMLPMKFNRLVLLRPFLFHTAGPGFGDAPENARLVYLMFFNQPPQG